ncbi:Hypothetical protein PP7435_CHR2-0954 [Komagataella phaffii CBS 7435]|uniref:Uncharacterized protein n=2 Tax=Komagataella phaffii TaxID=460519 RepID=C4R0E1_KOMPG|nr:uncharacterized protein PAS_chr2-1_0893 [Komagataella phaffii GS115]CAH2448519.1 Hypothetical protein BQ9382_C2-5135 [Komagataella phaffii CBS 7435]CAY68965.1 hypothetical protein PAS_chr2-1_0893 [Komagataella phaffii GS115]CCA38635.1 Hypothetical protein PP7435_CHR2-0954 [Komagataella phaffii CBS 7435]
MSQDSDPILSRLPLVAIPGKYTQPKPITLPYEFIKLPDQLNKNMFNSKKDRLKSLVSDCNDLEEKLKLLTRSFNDDISEDHKGYNPVAYDQWVKETNSLAPGYFDDQHHLLQPKKPKQIHDNTSTMDNLSQHFATTTLSPK